MTRDKKKQRQESKSNIVVAPDRLSKLADNDSKNQENQNGDDGDGDYFIRSHSEQC